MALNPAQAEAVSYVQGPCLVLAGAGSGKTRVITAKIVKLYRDYMVQPQRICALTFTNKAAAEMRERVARELGKDVAARIWISTFHSLGLEIVRLEHDALGLPAQFSLFDENDVRKTLRDILRDEFSALLEEQSERDIISDAMGAISDWKGRLIAPRDLSAEGASSLMGQIYRSYSDYLKSCHALDFDDLIFLTTRLLKTNDYLRQKWSQCFRYVLVDEYQDTNETQYQMLRILISGNLQFTVVGDDDQSIYAWRGARPENIRLLADDFPNLKVIKLEQNYRSMGRILNCANVLISHNPHLFTKTLRASPDKEGGQKILVMECASETEEAYIVTALIKGKLYEKRVSPGQIAVLYRSNSQSRLLEQELRLAHIPCMVSGGDSFFDQTEVKDIICYCRLIANFKDHQAFVRIANVPPRGIGRETLHAINELAAAKSLSGLEACMLPELKERLKPAQLKAVNDFVILMTRLRQKLLNHQDAELARTLIEDIGYERHLRASALSPKAADYQIKSVHTLMEWIGELIRGRFGEARLDFARAVERMGLKELMEKRADNDSVEAVQLMTLHASKGLEFPMVILIGMEENILPHRNSMEGAGSVEEERRLAYVGITRAMRSLTLTWCRSRRNGGETHVSRPSRFIDELPPEDLIFHSASKPIEISKERLKNSFDLGVSTISELAKNSR